MFIERIRKDECFSAVNAITNTFFSPARLQTLHATEPRAGLSRGRVGEGRTRRFSPMVQGGQGRLRSEPASEVGETIGVFPFEQNGEMFQGSAGWTASRIPEVAPTTPPIGKPGNP